MINLVIIAGFFVGAAVLYYATQRMTVFITQHKSYDEDDELCVLMDDPDYIQLLSGRFDLRACRITAASGREIIASIENIPFDLAILSEENYEYIEGMKCVSGKCVLPHIGIRCDDDDDEERNIRILYSDKFTELISQLVSKGVIREAEFIA